jgi:hypothetical protein
MQNNECERNEATSYEKLMDIQITSPLTDFEKRHGFISLEEED